ncbi:MAG: dioxygenase [Coriobacteriia bacterium]|nr:dioxygenase [Coriobacteriia bacterium]
MTHRADQSSPQDEHKLASMPAYLSERDVESPWDVIAPTVHDAGEQIGSIIMEARHVEEGVARQLSPRAVSGYFRKAELTVPEEINQARGISFFGRAVKSLVFSTDVAIIRNCDADAVLAVYPFTCQPAITQAVLMAAERPVFTGVAGGITKGLRSVELAIQSEMQGASGVVANMMTDPETLKRMANSIDIPVVLTMAVMDDHAVEAISAGVRVVNVAAGKKTPKVVEQVRQAFPEIPIMASGGPDGESILRTIEAGADAITWTPPNIQDIERQVMLGHRIRANA